jgi:uncharacterized protein YcfL
VKRAPFIVATALLLAGCGSVSHQSSPTVQQSQSIATTTAPTPTEPTSTSTQEVSKKQNTRKTLRSSVRAALLADHHLAIHVLWTNRIPGNATNSTRGPALAGMRASANDRQSKGIRVRMVHDNYRIRSIAFAPSLATATAVAESIQTLQPSHLNGRPLGRSVRLKERARISLRRFGASQAFVVWSITLLK